jgi:hypothetical protein
MFYKLAITGALIAALAAPAGASAQRARTAHQARAQAFCPQSVVFLPAHAGSLSFNPLAIFLPGSCRDLAATS